MVKSIQRLGLIVVSVIMLAACGGLSNEELAEKNKEAMDDAKSMMLEFNEKETNGVSKGTTYLMDKGEQFRIDYEYRDSVLYGDKDVLLIQEGSYVEDISANRDNVNVETIIELFVNPLEVFEEMDEDFLEHIEVEEKDDEISIEYIGDEDDENSLIDMGEAYLKITLSDQQNRDFDEIDVSKFALTMDIDAETYLANKVHLKVTYEEQGIENKMNQKYTYKEYDKLDEIEKPELGSSDDIFGSNNPSDDPSEVNSPGEGELDQDVIKGAGEYVEALIYATVYQDEKAFVSSAPESMPEKEAKEHAKLQKESFREIYKSNTKNNMAGLNVTEEQFDQLTDAFLDAISKAEFKVLTSTATDPENVVVTVSINGINNTKVYEDTEKKLEEAVAADEGMSQDDIVSKNLEILTAEYKNVEKIKEPVEVPVNVMIQNGQYMVLLQDEYLMGFVQ